MENRPIRSRAWVVLRQDQLGRPVTMEGGVQAPATIVGGRPKLSLGVLVQEGLREG